MAGADGTNDIASAAKRMADRAKRAGDLSPVLKVFGAWIDKTTNDDFQGSHEFDGKAFPALAASTIDARIARHGGFKRTSGGKFTKGALKKQTAFSASGGIKPLIDTAVQMNSARTTMDGKNGLKWSAVGRLMFHITGSLSIVGRPPRRNPTVFEVTDGVARLQPKAQAILQGMVSTYIMDGKVSAP